MTYQIIKNVAKKNYYWQIKNRLVFLKMNIFAGIQFIVSILIFGIINYYLMLKRFKKETQIKKSIQIKKISRLYPKGTFIGI